MDNNLTDTITDKIIGAAIEVHKELGCGLLEKIYEEALCYEFKLRGINYERQREVDVIYKNERIRGKRIDLLVENDVIVELKAVQNMNEYVMAQVLSYLKATGLRKALIINFGESRLVTGIRRVSL